MPRVRHRDFLEHIACVLVGIMSVDLVFDYGDPATAQIYYETMLPSAVVTIAIPCMLVLLAACVFRRLYKTPKAIRPWLLLLVFVSAAPYFELVVKQAELDVAAATTVTPEVEMNLGIIRNGHLLLFGIAIVCLVVSFTEPVTKPPVKQN